jgi:hypothetical protein
MLVIRKLLILTLLLFTGCDEIISLSKVIDVSIRVLYVDGNGDNLLDNANAQFNPQDFKLYYYNDAGKYVKLFDGRLDNPDFIQQDSVFILLAPVFGEQDGTYVKGGRSTSYLDFGNGDIDTIQVDGEISKSKTFIHDVWYNGKHVQWLGYCEFRPCGFTVVK